MKEDFENQLRKAYVHSNCPFSYEEALYIFRYYFEKYKHFWGINHPSIGFDKLVSLLNDIDGDGLFTAEDYTSMIDAYFKTRFRNSDRNIIHFFSGKIRELRYYETIL